MAIEFYEPSKKRLMGEFVSIYVGYFGSGKLMFSYGLHKNRMEGWDRVRVGYESKKNELHIIRADGHDPNSLMVSHTTAQCNVSATGILKRFDIKLETQKSHRKKVRVKNESTIIIELNNDF